MIGDSLRSIFKFFKLGKGNPGEGKPEQNSKAGKKPDSPIDYHAVYEQLYQKGYHSDSEFSNAKDLVEWILTNLEFESVLDIGCAGGWAVEALSRSGKQAQGIDAAETAIQLCRERGLNRCWAAPINCHSRPANLTS